MKKITFLCFILALNITFGVLTYAQAQCGTADSIAYPIDTSAFTLAQDYAAPSSRHQGRYHTGEDWFGGSAGLPVQAAANGRVTYASPAGWGRDGGVIIIEHTFPDGSVAYSQYGHIMMGSDIAFPAKFDCVSKGQVIALVGDARPAPHLHFEIRVNQPDIAGPGYTVADPSTLGWRRPAQFVTNWQAWLHPAHAWHLETDLVAPPLQLSDNSLLYLDGRALRLATYDGRVLWRILLNTPAVGIVGSLGTAILVYADGAMQVVHYDGTLGERWTTGLFFDSPPVSLGDGWLLHTADGALVAFQADLRRERWRLPEMPAPARAHVTGQSIALYSASEELLLISRDGRLLNRAALRSVPGLSTLPDTGGLLSYSRGGLWTVGVDGVWTYPVAWADQLPPGGAFSAALADGLARLYLFDGRSLYAYARDSALLWRADVTGVQGMVSLVKYDDKLLLLSAKGTIAAVSGSGRVCSRLQIYGDGRREAWHTLSSDGLLRVAVGGQMIGINWARFTQGCA